MEMKWVTDLKQELHPQTPVSKKYCIYRVPMRIKDINVKAYEPHIVSFGPYHHGKPNLKRMEYDKRRVLSQFLERTGKPIEEFGAALEEVVEELMDSYEDLEGDWRDKERFLPLMLIDGCFLLEFMGRSPPAFAADIPKSLRVRNESRYILLDMLMVENQVPMLALERLWAIGNGIPKEMAHLAIHELVRKWNYFPRNRRVRYGLHLLDVYQKSMFNDQVIIRVTTSVVKLRSKLKFPSAVELHDAGVKFARRNCNCPLDVRFENGVLMIPTFLLDQGEETIYLNLIAYEQLNPEAGYVFQAYINFMSQLVKSARDVVLLKSVGIIESTLGSDEAVADLLKMLAKNVLANVYPVHLIRIRVPLYEYYIKNTHKWRKRLRYWGRNLKLNYFNSPWTLISVIAAAAVLVLTFVQTFYSIISYHNPK